MRSSPAKFVSFRQLLLTPTHSHEECGTFAPLTGSSEQSLYKTVEIDINLVHGYRDTLFAVRQTFTSLCDGTTLKSTRPALVLGEVPVDIYLNRTPPFPCFHPSHRWFGICVDRS